MPAACSHVAEVRDDWPPPSTLACDDCAATGEGWVSLRRCLSCGRIGCCDSSPNRHASAHHETTAHPMIRTLEPGHDWVWCYVDEIGMRRSDTEWIEVDLFFEVGLSFMRDHLGAGGEVDVATDATAGSGFPLGQWVGEMRRRHSEGRLDDRQARQIEALTGWRRARRSGS